MGNDAAPSRDFFRGQTQNLFAHLCLITVAVRRRRNQPPLIVCHRALHSGGPTSLPSDPAPLGSLAGAMVKSSSGEGVGMAGGKARLPPRWFIVTFWHGHRLFVRATGGRKGLWPPRPGKYGALRLTTRGRRSGESRSVIVGYYEDGPNLVTMAMNGWGDPEPAWWLNLQARPETTYDNFLADFGERFVPGYRRMSTVDLLMNAPFAE